MNSIQRSLTALTLAAINQPHMTLLKEQGVDVMPYQKLLQKQRSYLSGELKSEANLLRFFEQFSEWRQIQSFDANLNDRIADLCCASLYGSVEMMHDPECDDLELLYGYIDQLFAEIDELGGESETLAQYFEDIKSELTQHLNNVSQRPVKKEFFKWLDEQDISLFGLAN